MIQRPEKRAEFVAITMNSVLAPYSVREVSALLYVIQQVSAYNAGTAR